MYFGNKTVEFREDHTDERRTVDLKSNYIMIPIDIKYSAKRLNNYCPYITAGVAGAFDISKKKNAPVLLVNRKRQEHQRWLHAN